MARKTALQKRTEKATAIQSFVGIQQTDRDGKIRSVLVPGSKAKRYQVIVRRPKAGIISTECRLEAGSIGHQNCKGNSNGYVCYHSLAAIEKAASEKGMQVAFCSTYQNAARLSRLNGGKTGLLYSHQGRGVLHLVVYKR